MVVAVSVYHCSEQPEEVVHAATMPLVLGGVVLRSTRRVSSPAHWRSWADSLAVIRSRHPPLGRGAHAIFEGSQDDGFRTVELAGGGPLGARPLPRDPEDVEPGTARQDWQHEASSWVEQHVREEFSRRVLLHSPRSRPTA